MEEVLCLSEVRSYFLQTSLVYFLDGVVVARRTVMGLRLLLLRVPVIIWRWGVVEGSVVVER